MLNVRNIVAALLAGAFGGWVNGIALWLLGQLGVNQALGFAMAPPMTWSFLLPRLLYGGLWGLLFLIPFWPGRPYAKGALLSLAPTTYMLFKVLPVNLDQGVLGLGLGPGTPFMVLFYNVIWGIAAGWLWKLLRAPGSRG
jgi:hypothetical protein